MSKAEDHKLIGALGRALCAMHADRAIFATQYDNHHYKMTEHIQNLRKIRQWRPPLVDFKRKERDRITNNLNDTFKSRKISVKIGSAIGVERKNNPYPERRKEYQYNVTVGWMWYRTVYLPFYQGNCLERSWLVLKAEELSVNHRAIRLFEAVAFHFATGKTARVYIGQAGFGALSADLRETQKEAIDRALKLADRIVTKQLLGDKPHEYPEAT